jgi:hypothetical protein
MSVTVDGPADFPVAVLSHLTESAPRFASRRGLRRCANPDYRGWFSGWWRAGFLAFACALGAELFLATTSPLTT